MTRVMARLARMRLGGVSCLKIIVVILYLVAMNCVSAAHNEGFLDGDADEDATAGDDPEETSIFTSEEVPLFTTDDSFSFTTEEDSAPTLSATLEFFTTEDALTTSARTTSRTSTTASASASATAADGSAHKREIGAALALPLLGLLAI
jgi:hypothetical protein